MKIINYNNNTQALKQKLTLKKLIELLIIRILKRAKQKFSNKFKNL